MNHGTKHRKFGRRKEHREAMFINLSKSLIKNGIIKTTLPKAKSLRPIIEKVITLAKVDNFNARRKVASFMHGNCPEVDILFKEVAKKSAKRNGGYTRIMKLGFRSGDNAPMAMIELVDRVEEKRT